jgi:hypothetical protein
MCRSSISRVDSLLLKNIMSVAMFLALQRHVIGGIASGSARQITY